MRFLVLPGEEAYRTDSLVAQKAGITRSQARKLIDSGKVLVNGAPAAKAGGKLKPGENVEVEAPPSPDEKILKPETCPLSIVYLDDYLAVVDKPAGMVVYPGAGHREGTLLNALAHHTGKLASVGGPLRPGVVHRLDKDTSGLIAVALDDKAYYGLVEQFRVRSIRRSYEALIWGGPREDEGIVTLAIGRSATDRKKMSTRSRRGKEAVTRWKVLKRYGKKSASLIQAVLATGRTHQIRVHLASLGHPVLGDRTYGRKTSVELPDGQWLPVPRQMLHAKTLGFIHPVTGQPLEFESPLPPDMAELVETLEAAR